MNLIFDQQIGAVLPLGRRSAQLRRLVYSNFEGGFGEPRFHGVGCRSRRLEGVGQVRRAC